MRVTQEWRLRSAFAGGPYLRKAHVLRAHPQRSLHQTVVFVHGQPALSHKEPGAFAHGPRAHLRINDSALVTKPKPGRHLSRPSQLTSHTCTCFRYQLGEAPELSCQM